MLPLVDAPSCKHQDFADISERSCIAMIVDSVVAQSVSLPSFTAKTSAAQIFSVFPERNTRARAIKISPAAGRHQQHQSFEVTVSMLQNRPVQIGLRPALEHDFEYCRRLYFAEMRWIIDELRLDRNAQETSFGQQWNRAQVRVIALEGTDVGWLQTVREEKEIFVAQMFVDSPFQRRGVGTEVMKRLISEA